MKWLDDNIFDNFDILTDIVIRVCLVNDKNSIDC